ncbi:MAG: CinA family protein [Rhodospirillales bacterium]
MVDLVDLAAAVLDACRRRGWRLAAAESCTGGLVAAALTEIAGSSDVFERGFVTYSNAAKTEMLGVPGDVLAAHGAVSEPVARSMAEGALVSATPEGALAGASATGAAAGATVDLAVSVTGIAGPGGGSAEKPVGLVHFALAAQDRETRAEHQIFPGDRTAVRRAAARRALELLLAAAS